jgi:hypothetical protein
MALFRKSPASSPDAASPAPEAPPDPVEAAQLRADAAAVAVALAHAEVEAAKVDAARAADFSSFPGDDADAALAQLLAQRAASKRAAAAADALARDEAVQVDADASLASAKHAALVQSAASFHWGVEWAGRALVAGINATPEGRPVQGLTAAVALCRQAVTEREALREDLASAGITPPPAPRLSLAAALDALLSPEPGLLGDYLTAVNVVRYEAGAAERARADAANTARADADEAAHQQRMDMAGHRGPAARAAALAAQHTALVRFYGRPVGAAGIPSFAPVELATRAEVE